MLTCSSALQDPATRCKSGVPTPDVFSVLENARQVERASKPPKLSLVCQAAREHLQIVSNLCPPGVHTLVSQMSFCLCVFGRPILIAARQAGFNKLIPLVARTAFCDRAPNLLQAEAHVHIHLLDWWVWDSLARVLIIFLSWRSVHMCMRVRRHLGPNVFSRFVAHLPGASQLAARAMASKREVKRVRCQTDSETAVKRLKLAGQWEQLANLEEEKRRTENISWVMNQMLLDPANVDVAKQAIIGRQHRLAKGDAMSEPAWYPTTYIYLYKIPRERCCQKTLPLLDERLTKETLAKLKKADKCVDQKLLTFLTGTKPSFKIWHHQKSILDSLMKERSVDMLRDPAGKLQWQPDGAIDWSTVGVYRLLPSMPEGQDPKEWQFTSCSCIYLPEDKNKALLNHQLTHALVQAWVLYVCATGGQVQFRCLGWLVSAFTELGTMRSRLARCMLLYPAPLATVTLSSLVFTSFQPVKAEIPENFKVTGEWSITENWHVSATLISPKSVKPKSTIDCADFFTDIRSFKEIIAPVPVVENQNRPKGDEAEAATDATSEFSSEVKPSDSVSQVGLNHSDASLATPSTTKKAGALSKKDVAAAVAKLRRKAASSS